MNKKQKRFELLLSQTRASVGSLMDAGFSPPEITFALAYIATELGLTVADKPVEVFPLVLSAVSQATADCEKKNEQIEVSPNSIEVMQRSSLSH
jgi:hypothetical protein